MPLLNVGCMILLLCDDYSLYLEQEIEGQVPTTREIPDDVEGNSHDASGLTRISPARF